MEGARAFTAGEAVGIQMITLEEAAKPTYCVFNYH